MKHHRMAFALVVSCLVHAALISWSEFNPASYTFRQQPLTDGKSLYVTIVTEALSAIAESPAIDTGRESPDRQRPPVDTAAKVKHFETLNKDLKKTTGLRVATAANVEVAEGNSTGKELRHRDQPPSEKKDIDNESDQRKSQQNKNMQTPDNKQPVESASTAEPSQSAAHRNTETVIKNTRTRETPGRSSSALPDILYSPHPVYPEDARWEGRTGKVTLKFQITERGFVSDVHVQDTSGHLDLDHAALASITQWRFNSGEHDAFSGYYYYSFRFELN